MFDTLAVGRGPDPTNQSTVVFEFSEELNGQLISGFIPEREFWFVFKTDWTVSRDGFRAVLVAIDGSKLRLFSNSIQIVHVESIESVLVLVQVEHLHVYYF